MKKQELKKAISLIKEDFPLEGMTSDQATEEELLQYLANEIAYLIERNPEFLFSLMYRLDVDEKLVDKALSPFNKEAANITIARLVLDRQIKRAHTKLNYKPPTIDNQEDVWE